MDQHDWHQDKKVTLGLIFALLAQAGAIVWWAAGIEHRMVQTETELSEVKSDHAAINAEMNAQGRQVVVIVEQMANTNRLIEQLRQDVRETNGLLREIVTQYGGGRKE